MVVQLAAEEEVEYFEDPDDDGPRYEWEDYPDEEPIEWSWRYVYMCLFMPVLNGCVNTLLWPALALYFRERQWPLVDAGLAAGGGYLLRWSFQQLQLHMGLWLAVPMLLPNLTSAILAIVYTEEEWAILLEVLCILGLDITMCLEGTVYESFGKDSDSISQQATSTSLSVMGFSVALGCVCSAFLYDMASWKGLAIFHCACISLMLLVMTFTRTTRESFSQVFLTKKTLTVADIQSHAAGDPTTPDRGSGWDLVDVEDHEQVVPGAVGAVATMKGKRTDASLLQRYLDEMDDLPSENEFDDKVPRISGASAVLHGSRMSHATSNRTSNLGSVDEDSRLADDQEVSTRPRGQSADEFGHIPSIDETGQVRAAFSAGPSASVDELGTPMRGSSVQASGEGSPTRQSRRNSKRSTRSRRSRNSRSSRKTTRSRLSRISSGSRQTVNRTSVRTFHTQHSEQSGRTHLTKGTGGTGKTMSTGMASLATVLTHATNLAEAGMHFEHFFIVNVSLRPRIVTAGGRKFSFACPETKTLFKKGSRLPPILVILAAFAAHSCYMIETIVYGLYFKEEFGFFLAIFASLGQAVGDVIVVLCVQLTELGASGPVNRTSSGKMGRCSRCLELLFLQPYIVGTQLALLVVISSIFLLPFAPLAVTAQVFLASSYTLVSKAATELGELYAGDDMDVFVVLQNMMRNAQALGAASSCVLGLALYDVLPLLPLIYASGLGALVLLLYLSAYCSGWDVISLVEPENDEQ